MWFNVTLRLEMLFYAEDRDVQGIPHLKGLPQSEINDAYKRLMSIHIRRPSGDSWLKFAQEIIDNFEDKSYNELPRVDSVQEV